METLGSQDPETKLFGLTLQLPRGKIICLEILMTL